MKRFPKLIVTLLLLAMVIGIFAAMPVSAANEYEEFIKIKARHVEAGHYTSLSCDGELVQHSANTNYREEVGCMVDGDNKGAYWSKPYKFNDLKDNGGSIVPAAIYDVATANGNAPLAVAAFDLRLRSAYDCEPLHVVVQATTAADSKNWVTLADKKFSISDWDANPKQRVEFAETSVYKIRLLVYDIGEADVAADEYKDYQVVKGDETRFTLSEIGIMTIKKGGGSNSNSGSTKPTTGGNTQTPTRPVIQTPTRPVIGQPTTPTRPVVGQTTTPTSAPTQPATQAPTKAPNQPATQAPTKAPNQPTTPVATQAPTKAPNQPTTPVATQPATQAPTTNVPTEPVATVDPSAPTVEPTVDPSAPTVDPSAPTETVDPSAPSEEPTVAPTEDATTAPTTEATEPEATEPTDDIGGEGEPKDFPWIIVAIAGAVVVAAGAVTAIIIIKKKRG